MTRRAGVLPWRQTAIVVATLCVGTLSIVAAMILSPELSWAPAIPLGIVVAGICGWILLAACYGSPTALIIYFAALAFLTDAQFRVRGAGDISADWQSALKFLLWIGAGVIGMWHMPPLRTMLARPGCALWLAYITMAVASSVYSPIAPYSFGCALALLCLFAFSFALVKRLTQTQILWTLLLTITVFNIGGWFVYYVVPDLGNMAVITNSGILMRMCGLAGQPTNLGAICAKAVGCAFVLWWLRRSGWLTALILGGFAFATLVKSDTRTTEIATVVGIGAIVAARSVWTFGAATLSGVLGVVALQVAPELVRDITSGMSRSGDPHEVATLTGRLQIWEFAWEQIKIKPLMGWGYNSEKSVLGSHVGFLDGLMVDNAHNLYLQNLLSVGAIGTAFLVALILWLAYKCFVRPVPFVIYMLVVVFISSLSDTDSIGTTPTLMTIIFFMISIWPELYEPVVQSSVVVRGRSSGAVAGYLTLRT